MPNSVLVTVELPSTTGIPKDSVVNSFAFETDVQLTQANIGELTIPLMAFYNNQASGAGSSVAEYLSSNRKRTAAAVVFKAYDLDGHLDGSPHGSPFATDAGTLRAAFATNPLPSEVAVAMTIRGGSWESQPAEAPDGSDAGSAVDRPRQRYSGRIFLGPLDTRAINASGGVPRVEANFRSAILSAAQGLQAGVQAFGHEWAVWSRQDANLRHVEDVQVDNAFDVQRRRGEAATVRDSVAV